MIRVGDWVKIVGNTLTANPHGFRIGTVCKVEEVNFTNYGIACCTVVADTHWEGSYQLNAGRAQTVRYEDIVKIG